MNKYQKLIVLLLILIVVLTMVACSNSSEITNGAKDVEENVKNDEEKAKDDDVYTIIFAHHQNTDSPIGAGIERLTKTLNEKSSGRLKVQSYPAEQLGNESSVFEQMTQGTVQMSTFGYGIIGSMSPSALAMEMGYMFEDYDHLQDFLDSEVFKEISNDAIEACGVNILGSYYNGARHLTTSKTAVTDPESMKGLKIRVPNSEMILATIQAMNANATVMAFSETYMGLQNGTVDGQENPIPSIVSMKFQEVQGYLCKTGHMIQAATICINDDFLNSMPKDLRELIINETLAELQVVSQDVLKKEVDQEKILIDAGMQIIDVDRKAFKERMTDVISKYEKVWGEGLYERIQATNVK